MKLLRTIRLDPSDTFVFERAAKPGEWAVSGAFVFWNNDALFFMFSSMAICSRISHLF